MEVPRACGDRVGGDRRDHGRDERPSEGQPWRYCPQSTSSGNGTSRGSSADRPRSCQGSRSPKRTRRRSRRPEQPRPTSRSGSRPGCGSSASHVRGRKQEPVIPSSRRRAAWSPRSDKGARPPSRRTRRLPVTSRATENSPNGTPRAGHEKLIGGVRARYRRRADHKRQRDFQPRQADAPRPSRRLRIVAAGLEDRSALTKNNDRCGCFPTVPELIASTRQRLRLKAGGVSQRDRGPRS